jgi:hypothetical protein
MAEMKKLFIAFIAALLTLSFCTGYADPITTPEESTMPSPMPSPVPTISQEDLFKITDTATMGINIPKGLLVPKGQLAINCNFRGIDFNLAREKGLIGERNLVTGNYLTLQAIYKKAFYEYLSETIDFKKYEDMISGGELRIHSKTRDANAYQRFGSYGNEFLFLRNQFYIEQLSAEDLLSLAAGTALRELIIRTYRCVLIGSRQSLITLEAPYTNLTYFLPRLDIYHEERSYKEIEQNAIGISYAIVLGIRYDDNSMYGDAKQMRDYMNELRYQIQDEMALLLDYPIAIFVFDGAYDEDLGSYWDPNGPMPPPGGDIILG